MLVPSNDGLTQGCPAPPAAFSFLTLLEEEFFWSELVARAGEEAKEVTDLFAYLDDLTLVTEVRFLEHAIRAMESALAKARLIVNEMKGTVWTSTGMRPDGVRAGAMWDNVEDHEASHWLDAREPSTTRAAKHPTPTPVGNSSFSSASFRKGHKSHAGCPSTSRKSLTTRTLASQRYRPRAAC